MPNVLQRGQYKARTTNNQPISPERRNLPVEEVTPQLEMRFSRVVAAFAACPRLDALADYLEKNGKVGGLHMSDVYLRARN